MNELELTTKQKIQNKKDFEVKFADKPFNDDGILNSGWAEPTYDKFFERMTETPVLLDQSAVIPMTALQHDLDMLDGDVDFESQRDQTGNSKPLTNVEFEPDKVRKQLVAQPLQAKTIVTDNFLQENIESEDFLTHYLNFLASKMGPGFERWGLYSNPTSSATDASGFKMTNGILAQLETINTNPETDANGISNVVYNNNVGNGILDAIQTYVEQNGDIDKARCILPPAVHSKFMLEIAKNKDTPLGDAVFQDGNITSILGIEIAADPILRQTRNGYDKMTFDENGAFSPTGTAIDKMTYGFIGKPENLVFGMMREFDVINQWDIDVLGYKVAMLCKGDVKVLWDQDTLAVPFTRNESA